MGSGGHVIQGDGVDFLAVAEGAVACVVSKAVLDADNNPAEVSLDRSASGYAAAHQRFVKTTPNPNATKNRRGELLPPPPPPPPPAADDVALTEALVEVCECDNVVVGADVVECSLVAC